MSEQNAKTIPERLEAMERQLLQLAALVREEKRRSKEKKSAELHHRRKGGRTTGGFNHRDAECNWSRWLPEYERLIAKGLNTKEARVAVKSKYNIRLNDDYFRKELKRRQRERTKENPEVN